MTKFQLRELCHPSEGSRFWISMFVVVPALIAAILVVFASFGIALISVLAIIFFIWLVTEIIAANFLGDSVKISSDNFPEINDAVEECKELFRYRGQIDVYIYENSGFNALVLPLMRRKFILINSDVIEKAQSSNEVRWLIARFIGALASKHYRFAWLQAVIGSIEKIMVLNVLLYPYERAVAKSGDQLGLYAINGDIESAVGGLQKMMVGGSLGGRVNLSGVLRQQEAIGGTVFGWLARCLSPFPHTTSRVQNLLRFSAERYPLQLQTMLAGKDETTLTLVRRATGLAAFGLPVGAATFRRTA